MNSYPFLDNKHKPVFTGDLADIVPRVRWERVIDITTSPQVSATSLRRKVELLHRAGEIDGGLPILRNDILVGLIPAPDLQFALDQLDDEATAVCLMADIPSVDEEEGEPDPTDFTPYIDPVCFSYARYPCCDCGSRLTDDEQQAPVALDVKSPMDLVYECFAKLGLRYICVLKDGKYAGMVSRERERD